MSQAEARRAAPGTSAPAQDPWDQAFREDLAADTAFERRLLYRELGIIAIIGVLIVLREMLL